MFFYNEEKSLWRISYALDSPGAFGKIKEKVDAPWEVKKVWKIFNGNGSFDEDPDLKITLLDPEDLPQGVEVEVCLPTCPAIVAAASSAGAASSSGRKREREVPSASAGGENGKKEGKKDKKSRKDKDGKKDKGSDADRGNIWNWLPEDAPEGHDAYEKVKHDPIKNRAIMQAPCGGKRIAFQTTLSYCFESVDALMVIARACYIKFLEGKTKEEVVDFRNQCYERLANWDPDAPQAPKPEPAAASSQPAAEVGAAEAVPAAAEAPATKAQSADDKKAKKQADKGGDGGNHKRKKASGASAGSSSSGASGSSSSSDSGSESGSEEAAAKVAPVTAPSGEVAPAAAAAAPADAATGVPKKFALAPACGNLAAKMAVRTGVRCTCCYAAKCRRRNGATVGKAA